MKQVCSCTPCSHKLLCVQFLALVYSSFACKTSFTAEALGLAQLPKLFYQVGRRKRKVVSTAICPALLLLPPTSLGKTAHIALPNFKRKSTQLHSQFLTQKWNMPGLSSTHICLFYSSSQLYPFLQQVWSTAHRLLPSELCQQQLIKATVNKILFPPLLAERIQFIC